MRNSLILYRNLKYGELFQRMGSLLERERRRIHRGVRLVCRKPD